MKIKDLKLIVKNFNTLCKSDNYKSAGELARKHKNQFIEFVKKANNSQLLYCYKVCGIFNMRQTDCYNLKDFLFN